MDKLTKLFQGQISARSRVLILVTALIMLPSIFLPTWNIKLHAPQYPDGLNLTIYPTTVGGDLREVNLLNHYIGMKHIDPGEFPEFRFIPFFILRFLGLAVLAALVGRMPIAALGWLDFVVFGTVMLYTFQHWLWEFGNNLSPNAPLNVKPFTPHFIGATHVGQFSVTSTPAVGAMIMFLAGAIGPAIVFIEWKRLKREESQ